MTNSKNKWRAVWDETDVMIAESNDRKELGLLIQHFVENSVEKLRGHRVTIKIFEVDF